MRTKNVSAPPVTGKRPPAAEEVANEEDLPVATGFAAPAATRDVVSPDEAEEDAPPPGEEDAPAVTGFAVPVEVGLTAGKVVPPEEAEEDAPPPSEEDVPVVPRYISSKPQLLTVSHKTLGALHYSSLIESRRSYR